MRKSPFILDSDIALVLGVNAPSISSQLQNEDLPVDVVEQFQFIADAISALQQLEYITTPVAFRCRSLLVDRADAHIARHRLTIGQGAR